MLIHLDYGLSHSRRLITRHCGRSRAIPFSLRDETTHGLCVTTSCQAVVSRPTLSIAGRHFSWYLLAIYSPCRHCGRIGTMRDFARIILPTGLAVCSVYCRGKRLAIKAVAKRVAVSV